MKTAEISIDRFFDAEEVDAMARECEFVRRKSPVTGMRFMLTFTTGLLNTPEGTLAQLAAFLDATCETPVSPQAVDERINAQAKEFLGMCLRRALKMSAEMPRGALDALAAFDHVYVIDSTNFELHPGLAPQFKGSGGGASAAAMRIQFAFDFCSGIMHVEVGDVRLTDAAALARLLETEALPAEGTCLFLFDLGYFKLSTFAHISSRPNHHFLSKLQFNVRLSDLDGTDLNLQNILKTKPSEFELDILMDGTRCRLVGRRLSDEAAGQRIRKANKASESKSGRISDKYRLFLHYALFVTSLPPQFGMAQLHALYRIRWQVELTFKVWKSILSIHVIRSAKENRVLCEVYGKLIVAVLAGAMSAAALVFLQGTAISPHKAARHIKSVAVNWALAILKGPVGHRAFLGKLLRALGRLCRKTRQRNKPTIEDILTTELSIICAISDEPIQALT